MVCECSALSSFSSSALSKLVLTSKSGVSAAAVVATSAESAASPGALCSRLVATLQLLCVCVKKHQQLRRAGTMMIGSSPCRAAPARPRSPSHRVGRLRHWHRASTDRAAYAVHLRPTVPRASSRRSHRAPCTRPGARAVHHHRAQRPGRSPSRAIAAPRRLRAPSRTRAR